jgi:hypothetical protein
LAFSLPIFPNLAKNYPERARPRSAHPRFPGPSSKKKKDRVSVEKSAKEKDLAKGLNVYRNKFRVPDTKHETRS